jgi:hypothetical protein
VQSNRRDEAPGSSISHLVDDRQAQTLPEDGREETAAADAPRDCCPKEARSGCVSGEDGPQAETLPEDSPGRSQTVEAQSEGWASGQQEERFPMD